MAQLTTIDIRPARHPIVGPSRRGGRAIAIPQIRPLGDASWVGNTPPHPWLASGSQVCAAEVTARSLVHGPGVSEYNGQGAVVPGPIHWGRGLDGLAGARYPSAGEVPDALIDEALELGGVIVSWNEAIARVGNEADVLSGTPISDRPDGGWAIVSPEVASARGIPIVLDPFVLTGRSRRRSIVPWVALGAVAAIGALAWWTLR